MTTAAETGTPAPAAAAPQSILSFELTPADALAWVRRSPSVRRSDRIAIGGGLIAGLALLNFASGHLANALPQLHSTAVALILVALPALIVALVRRHSHRAQAAEIVARPTAAEVHLWTKRLALHRADQAAPLVLGAKSLRAVVQTRAHVFLAGAKGVVIVPATAFADATAMADFARHWQALL
ncbi:MAG: hypothetical protein RIT14_387 [Pseudomonadota bacterium]|jgi:hypothetical protein